MLIHADFLKSVIITPQNYRWVQSPNGEVRRMMLDRVGDEKARATSIVEFPQHSEFPEHSHPLGEEVLVLAGVFSENSDQHYPAGWYMRNPHQSKHRVSSEVGCQIFVKLMQMTEDELQPTRINTHDPKNWRLEDGRELCPLFQSPFEHTYLEKLEAHQSCKLSLQQGLEILVLTGALSSGKQVYPAGSWLRLPQDSDLQLKATETGANIYVKSGHLQHAMQVWSQKENAVLKQ
ncbi:cupin domain-containing protein [Acinetobacter sp. B51(2017)]|uniref:cupin domain-containing protein n=1 Tax=Acinetobacter sp. B51(2017) TaxID=2060938 RepID=UPI000F07AEDA|nr:cupin domain-containing protein [Acinetobacter sp. B51(2017)]